MKFQPKRFVVEVKRGTNRAAFASPDPSADRFSNAEATLFGASPKIDEPAAQQKTAQGEATAGRVLRSLVEPPPVVEEPAAPVRRGRKPGSKNKPKLHSEAPSTAMDAEAAAERPRRGRKPGSKNKPKPSMPDAVPHVALVGRDRSGIAMRDYGFAEDGIPWTEASSPADLPPSAPAPAPSPGVRGDVEGRVGRLRLRDRSTILRRYVLDLEPGPGQFGALRARRLARAAR